MKIHTPLKSIESVRDAIFLAGPTPRCGVEYIYDCEWRKQLIEVFQQLGFSGDIIDPVNRSFSKGELPKQIKWEVTGLKLASVIIFWIPRSKEHPALTTNIELGEWLNHPTTFVGWPPEAEKNEYIEERCKLINKPVYHSLSELAQAVMNYFNFPIKWFATSDTHFNQERTLELSRRPFRNVQEMNLALISNWNKKVRSKDGIIHLGDFGDFSFLPKLNFKKMIFVPGNYERKDLDFRITDSRIQIVKPGTEIIKNSKSYCLTHEPLYETGSKDKFWLFGHIHRLQIVKRNGINVGTDCYRFSPIDFDEIEFLRGGIENHFDENVFTEEVRK